MHVQSLLEVGNVGLGERNVVQAHQFLDRRFDGRISQFLVADELDIPCLCDDVDRLLIRYGNNLI